MEVAAISNLCCCMSLYVSVMINLKICVWKSHVKYMNRWFGGLLNFLIVLAEPSYKTYIHTTYGSSTISVHDIVEVVGFCISNIDEPWTLYISWNSLYFWWTFFFFSCKGRPWAVLCICGAISANRNIGIYGGVISVLPLAAYEFSRCPAWSIGYPCHLWEQQSMALVDRNSLIYRRKSDLHHSLLVWHYQLLILQEGKLHQHAGCLLCRYPVIHTRVAVFIFKPCGTFAKKTGHHW